MGGRLKLVYAAGPGNVIGTYIHWREGREDPSQVARTYSGQFFDLVRELNAQALVIARHPSGETVQDGDFQIEHRPIPFSNNGGILYHIGQTFAPLRLLWKSWRFGAHALIVSEGSGHWFSLRLAPLLGIKMIPTIHCVLWCKGARLDTVQKNVNHLNRTFFARSASGILVISHTITNQIEELTGNLHPPIYEFLPTYCCDQFDSVRPPPGERRPFRVFFAGRIERNKGVFGLLEIAKRFYHEGRNEIEFDLAGDGSSLAQLHHATSEAGETINQRFRFHGKVNKDQMLELLSRAHVVIVPTTSDFVEGFNKVVAEGVLSGRPVITSNVCPALEYVREAVVEVPPDDFQAYGNAILQLCDDKAFYEEKVAGCRDAQDQFYDSSRGWGAMLKAGLLATGLPRQERN